MINIDETFKLTRGKGQKAQLYTILHLNKVKVVKTRANTTPKAKTGEMSSYKVRLVNLEEYFINGRKVKRVRPKFSGRP